jgi:hypothetical protein
MRREHGFVAVESTNLPWSESEEESSDDEPNAFCLMAKSSKDQVQTKHRKISSDSSESIAYIKLVKIAKSQQDELDRLERNLRKSEGLLVKEMDVTSPAQSCTNHTSKCARSNLRNHWKISQRNSTQNKSHTSFILQARAVRARIHKLDVIQASAKALDI